MSNKEQHYAIKLTLTIFIWTSRPPHFRFHSILFLFNSILSCSIEWTSKPAEPSMLFVSSGFSSVCNSKIQHYKLSKYISNLLFCFISFHSQLLHFNVKKPIQKAWNYSGYSLESSQTFFSTTIQFSSYRPELSSSSYVHMHGRWNFEEKNFTESSVQWQLSVRKTMQFNSLLTFCSVWEFNFSVFSISTVVVANAIVVGYGIPLHGFAHIANKFSN